MTPSELWRERARPLVLFPGLILLALGVEVGLLRPRAAERSPQQSVEFWERHAAAHPDYASSQIRVGQEYQLRGRIEQARAAYQRALAVDPDSWFAAIGLNGVARSSEGRRAAVLQMQAFLATHPDCLACRQNLAADLLALGDVPAARRHIDAVLASRTYRPPLHYGLVDSGSELFGLAGRIYEASGEPEEASRLYHRALQRDPDNPGPHRSLGMLLTKRDPETAASHLERYSQLRPQDVRGPLLHARALLASGQADAALARLETARAQPPAPPDSDAGRRWRRELSLEVASTLLSLGRRGQAERELTALLRDHPGFARAEELAKALRAQGDP
jgi:tetratricopeptide (TPR) repeat protein